MRPWGRSCLLHPPVFSSLGLIELPEPTEPMTMRVMKIVFLLVAIILFGSPLRALCQVPYAHQVTSPDGSLVLKVSFATGLEYSVEKNGEELIHPSPISFTLGDGRRVGTRARPIQTREYSEDRTLRPVVPEKAAAIRDHFNQLSLTGYCCDRGAGKVIANTYKNI